VKRRYKAGDWFRVPLPGERDAIGIITHACRSRLFGYFFAVEPAHEPSFEELKRLHARDAVASALFGGAGLEQARWPLIATSLPFDPAAWPFPHFASRGVFGRTWHRVTYDPQTMSAVRREAVSRLQAVELPNARFATPEDLETFLQQRMTGEAPETPLVVCEIRSPVNVSQLDVLLSRGGRVQFSEMLDAGEMRRLAAFVNERPHIELRVHGLQRFDLHALRSFSQLRSLILDIGVLDGVEMLASLPRLESLRIGDLTRPASLEVLQRLPELHRLEVRGANADMCAVAQLQALDALTIIDTPPLEWTGFAGAEHLRSLVIAHVKGGVCGIAQLTMLERLALRDLQIAALPDLSLCLRLHAVELRNITMLSDLRPLAALPALRELRIEGMPQLHVRDFLPLRDRRLQNVAIEIGSKTKEREAYRLLRA
jgi:hypothetical protein